MTVSVAHIRCAATMTLALLLFSSVGAQSGGHANMVTTEYPSEADPGAPFYARLEPLAPHLYTDGDYAAVVFYRDPMGIPADFNLLSLFDPPAAFGVPLLVAGSNTWHERPGVGSPYASTARGLGAVPIWLVPRAALEGIVSTGSLTMVQLASIDGVLVGHADSFDEVLHPHPLPPALGGGGHPTPRLTLDASGSLEDGRRFDVLIDAHEDAEGQWRRATMIWFR